MTSIEAYNEFHVLMNKNASLRNINIPKPLYVLLYNRESKLSYRKLLGKSTDDLQDVSELLKTNILLEKKNVYNDFVQYSKPQDFFDFVDSVSTTRKEDCESITINYLYKPKDLKLKYSNAFYVNFEHEESIVNISDSIEIYKREYDILNSHISYYKAIPEIDIVGYFYEDGTPSIDKHPNISDRLVHIINNWIVLEVMREFENGNGINIAKDRVSNNS